MFYIPPRWQKLMRLDLLFGLTGMFLAAVFLGVIAASGNFFLLAIAGTGSAGLLLLVWALICKWSIPQLTLFVAVLLFFMLEVIHKTLGLALYGYWQAVVLMIGFLGLNKLWSEIKDSTVLRLSALAFAGFLILAILSSLLTSHSTANAALFQLVSDLKFPLALGFGVYIGSKVDVSSAIDRAIVVLIPVAMIFLLLQWVVPNAYLAVFRASQIPAGSAAIFPSPGLSFFNHPSILAATAAVLAIYSFAKWQIYKKQAGYSWASFAALTFLLIASNQRQETFAFILAVTGIYILASKQGMAKRLVFATVASLAVFSMYVFVFGDMFEREASSWGIASLQAATHPRAQLYENALQVAQTYFPLGSGLGTYGGVGSSKYNLSFLYQLGFASNWWWVDKEAYLLDTYWPNSLAESGFVGALLLLLHYLLFALHALLKAYRSQSRRAKMLWLSAAGSFLWVLFTTPTSPGFQEIRLLFFPALMFGIAVNLDRKDIQHA